MGHGWLAAGYGLLYGCSAQRFGADVQTRRPGVVYRRLDPLDYIEVFVLALGKLTQGEQGRAVGPLGSQKGAQIRAHDVCNETQSPEAMEFMG